MYSDGALPLKQEWDDHIWEVGDGLLIEPHLRLTLVSDEPAPAVLPRDLSPSLEDE